MVDGRTTHSSSPQTAAICPSENGAGALPRTEAYGISKSPTQSGNCQLALHIIHFPACTHARMPGDKPLAQDYVAAAAAVAPTQTQRMSQQILKRSHKDRCHAASTPSGLAQVEPGVPPKSHFHTLLSSLRALSMPPNTRMLFFQQSMVAPAVSITAAGAAAVKVWTTGVCEQHPKRRHKALQDWVVHGSRTPLWKAFQAARRA